MSNPIAPTTIPSNGLFNYDQSVVRTVIIRKLVLRESGTYNNQYSRTYDAHLSPQSVSVVANKAAESGMGIFRPSLLSGMASNMISISAAPESTTPLSIDNGWNSQRLLFFMDVLTEDLSGQQTVYYIQGYTDHVGLSLQSKALDPNLVFFINNIVVSRPMVPVNTPNGVMQGQSLVGTDHLLYDNQTYMHSEKWLMRPQDVFQVLTSNSFGASKGNAGEPVSVKDNRHRLQNLPKTSRRSNAIPSNYASNLISGFIDATHNMNPTSSPMEVYDSAVNVVAENSIVLNPFLSALSRHRSSGIISGSFTWNDMLKLDGSLGNGNNSRITVAVNGPTQQRSQHAAGMTAEWSGASIQTKYAATISQAIPALMLECMLYQISFTSNNIMRVEGNLSGIYTVVSNAASMHGGVVVNEVETFRRRLEMEVLKDISYNNQQKFDIKVVSNVFGDTWVSVSIDGGGYVDYATPTFCDGIISPVLTQNYATIENMANGVDILVSQVADAIQSSGPVQHSFAMPATGSFL